MYAIPVRERTLRYATPGVGCAVRTTFQRMKRTLQLRFPEAGCAVRSMSDARNVLCRPRV